MSKPYDTKRCGDEETNLIKNRKENRMGENENLELLNDSENVETPDTEEIGGEVEVNKEPAAKTYTQAELDDIVGKRLARNSAKIRKEYEKRYGELENVLKAGTGKEDVEEMTSTFRQFYEKKGIQIPNKPTYTNRDIEILAKAEAEDIISAGLDDVVEETNRLMKIGVENMDAREKEVFRTLAEYRQNAERGRELSKIGVTEDEYNSEEFKRFVSKFVTKTPITEIYEIYRSMKPRKEIRTMGSMKSNQGEAVKDYYSPEEIERLTEDDLDDPAVWDAVRRSMTGR
jgi:hypothetical protein